MIVTARPFVIVLAATSHPSALMGIGYVRAVSHIYRTAGNMGRYFLYTDVHTRRKLMSS